MKNARILIVEDETIVARDIQMQLLELGYEVVGLATRGEEAIAMTAQAKPDLVLMDIQLAGTMDGIAAADAIRANTQQRVPVVFLTAYDADDVLARAKVTEPFGYILKPFSSRVLHSVLEMALYKIQAEARLREPNLYSQAILDNMADGVLTFDTTGAVVSTNAAAKRMFGFQPGDALDCGISALVPPYMRPQLKAFLDQVQHRSPSLGTSHTREIVGQRKDGRVFPLSLSVSKMAQQGQARAFVGIARDLSPAQQGAEEIHQLAFFDSLTQLPNRRLFLDHMQQALLTSARNGQYGALILLNLDHFKRVNSTLGYDMGDLLLKEMARRLKAIVNESDLVARLGGDEFVVLLSAVGQQAQEAATQAEATVTKILQELGKPCSLDGHILNCTPSLGVVVFLAKKQSLEQLLKNAELAMRKAKEAGRSTFRFFDPAMHSAVVAHRQRVSDLQRALEQQDFLLHYQSQYDQNAQPIGVEALLRWQHPLRGILPAAEFIALAEETRLILPLGKWVLEKACTQLACWDSDPIRSNWSMAVNISPLQLAQDDFVANVMAALASAGANPQRLRLELTEGMLLKGGLEVVKKMCALREHKVQCALDDFGTGYSSLSSLRTLPLMQLKIDPSFVRDLHTNANALAIAQAIVALGHSLGLQVLAEGVENAAQRDLLASIQCDAFQGNHFAPPVAAGDLPISQ